LSIRNRLVALVGAATLPLVATLAHDAYETRGYLYREAEASALTQTRLMAARLNAIINGTHQLNRALIRYYLDGNADPAVCSGFARSLAASAPIYRNIVLIEPNGEVVCGALPWSPPLNVKDRTYFKAAVESQEIVLGEVIRGRLTGKLTVDISEPFQQREGDVGGVATHALDLDELARLLAVDFDISDRFLAVIDRSNTVVVQLPLPNVRAGEKAPADLTGRAALGGEIFEYRDERNGRDFILGAVPVGSPGQGWTVITGIDRSEALRYANQAILRKFVVGLAAVVLALVGASWVGTALFKRPILALAEAAERRRAGDMEALFPPTRSSTELGQLADALNQMSQSINALVEQKSILLREIQHRVMNSLQLLSSLLNMQERTVGDPKAREVLRTAHSRVMAMSAIYRFLHETKVTDTVDFGALLHQLCADLEAAYIESSPGVIAVDAESIALSTSVASSLGLIVHELVTNSLKHAYPAGRQGPIAVSLHREGEAVALVVADQGQGLPEDFEIDGSASLGMRMVQSLARSLGGTLAIERRAPGAAFRVVFTP